MKQALISIGMTACCLSGNGQFLFAADKPAAENRPNILFILSDDHTSQAWGIYGGVLGEYARNENIRRLAAEGCVLDNCFCTNSISVPSRAAILTGAYSHVNGVYTLSDSFDPEQDNIAKRMQAGGYQTALVGKWHLKTQPQGFDFYSVFHDQGEYRDPTFINCTEPWPGERNFGERVRGFSTDIVTEKAIRWMKEADKERPFLMCCHFKATHEPWDFPERMRHLYDGVVFPEPESLFDWGPETTGRTFSGQPLEELARRWEVASQDPDKWWCRYPELPFTTKRMHRSAARSAAYQKLVRDYLRCGAAIDDNIGKLLKALDDMGIADNTIVVYVSDQGYFLGEHGFFDKRMMYEESLRMPFVIRYPREIPAGTRNKDIVLNVDFASLLADYAGVKAPKESQGHSFRDNLRGDTPKDWRKEMYYRYWTQHSNRPAHMGIRNERYKLMFLYGDRLNMTGSEDKTTAPAWEFYDLQSDPRENRNAYDDPRYAKIIRQMKEEMLKLRKEVKDEDTNTPRMKEIMDTYYW
ncbi:sulfatase family protein [Parabacteroides sp.]